MTMIPIFLVSGQSGLLLSEYRGNPHFTGKIFFLIFEYFINQYKVIDDADSEFFGLRSIRIIIFRIPRNTAFYRENIFSYFLILYQPV